MSSYDAFDTRAAMAAVSSSPPAYAYVAEVDATYRYNGSSSATPDGWLTITSAAGGRYIATSYELQLPALGTGADDWPNFGALCAATATAGKKLRFGPYTYYCQSRQTIPNNAHVVLGPLTQIACDMGLVNNLDAPFTLQGLNYNNADALAADTNIGDMTFVITGIITPTVGSYLVFYDRQYRAAHYKVMAYNAGTKTVTIERPLRMPHGSPIATTSFPTGTQIFQTTIIENVKIEFNGAKIYGSAVRYIELILARKCNVIGPVYCGDGTTTTATDRIISLDESCYDCHASQIYADGAGVSVIGTSFEAAEASTYERCEMARMLNNGAYFQDAVDCAVHEQLNHNNGQGATFGAASDNTPPTGSGSVWGSQNCRIVGGSNAKNLIGILFEHGSSFCTVDSVAVMCNTNGVQETNVPVVRPAPGYYNKVLGNSMIRINSGNGFDLAQDSNYFLISDSNVNNNFNGVQIEASAVGPTIAQTRLDSNTGISLYAGANATVIGGGAVPPSTNTNVVVFQPNATWLDAVATNFTSTNASASALMTAGTLNLMGGRAAAVTNGYGIYGLSGATVNLDMEVTVSGAGSGGSNIYLASGATANVAQGATVANYSIRCATTANNVPTLNTLAGFSQHTG